MLDHLVIAKPPRVDGRAHVGAKLRGEASVLADLRQQGSAKILLPRRFGRDLDAVLLNTAGGITGGDRLHWRAETAKGSALTITTQAAERAYKAQPGETASVRTDLTLAPGARIDWLPQETILFDASALHRRLDVDMAEDAAVLAVEPILFGRRAMGERLTKLTFTDTWRIRRAGTLIYADTLRLIGNADAILSGPATLNGDTAMASALYIAPDAEQRLTALRPMLPECAGASLIRPGVLALRMTAPDGFMMRKTLIPMLECLRGAPLPKVWTM